LFVVCLPPSLPRPFFIFIENENIAGENNRHRNVHKKIIEELDEMCPPSKKHNFSLSSPIQETRFSLLLNTWMFKVKALSSLNRFSLQTCFHGISLDEEKGK